MGRKTPPFKHYNKWTEARFYSFIRSALRRAWMKWPPKYELLSANRKTVVGQRHRYEYLCSQCNEWHKQKDIEVDHKIPCGSLKCYDDLPGFVERMFVGPKGLRLVCRECHRKITNEAKALREKNNG